MAIDSHYIPAFSIEDVLLDKDTGAPLTGGLVYFEIDDQRGVLKPVYQITGASPDYTYTQLPNPLTLSAIGTFEDSLGNPVIPYFYPYDASGNVELYYLRVTSAEGVEQFTREAVPYVVSAGNNIVTSVLENELTNPQFAEVLFTSPITFTFNAVADEVITIAPGWDVVLTSPGVGSLTLTIITPTGSLNRITNPGTLLNIKSTGLTSLKLRQRLYGSPNLWGSGYLTATFIAKTYGGTSTVLNMYYSQSNGAVVDELLVSATLPGDGNYAAYPGSALIPISNSADFFPNAYIDIYFDIPLTTEIDISSVMVSFTNDVNVDNILYDQTSYDRQVDYTFHYYNPLLQFKPIPSYLVAWDFPLNPAQIFGDSVGTQAIGANKSYYAWDQTIVFQTADNSIAVSRESTSLYMNLTATTTTQAAVIQYLSGTQAQLILNQMALEGVSVMFAGSTTTPKTFTVSLWWSVNPIGTGMTSNDSLVTGLDATGYPTVAAGWTEITKLPLQKATFTTLTNIYQMNGFSNYIEPTAYLTGVSFAIVVGSSSIPAGEKISIASISIVPGKIPTIPAPQTLDQVLKECEFYYEKSYSNSSAAGAVDGQNSLISAQNAAIVTTQVGLYASGFNISFKNSKITTPAVNLFSPSTGVGTAVSGLVYTENVLRNSGDLDLANWTQTAIGSKNVYYVPANSTYLLGAAAVSTTNPQAFINYHYVADARLGLV